MTDPNTIKFPHAFGGRFPVQDFKIGERILSLYSVAGRSSSASYSLLWNDGDSNPIQHNMTPTEVFTVLHYLLEPEDEQSHQTKRNHGII